MSNGISTEYFVTSYGFDSAFITSNQLTTYQTTSINKLTLEGIDDLDISTSLYYQVNGYDNKGSQADILLSFQSPLLKAGGYIQINLDPTYFKASPGYIGQFCRVFLSIKRQNSKSLECFKLDDTTYIL
jgi:hypothetical protein